MPLYSSQIAIIPAFSDNYMYLLADDAGAAVVDPAEAAPVLAAVRERGVRLTHILVTHCHFDHTGGCAELKQATGCVVLGPDDRGGPGLDKPARPGQSIRLGGVDLEVMAVPGHTRTHLAYYAAELNSVFTGDVLFSGGCGRVMGCSYEEMFASLGRIASLPDATLVYGGHEYTLENMEFAAHEEPDNDAVRRRLEDVRRLRGQGLPTVPSTLAVEKATNPFLRPGLTSKAFADLRRRKDAW